MKYGITGFDVWEERVAQTLSLTRALHQTGDVHYVEKCGHFAAKGVSIEIKWLCNLVIVI